MDTNIFKKKLEEELKLVEGEISKIARRNPANPNDWEAIETDLNSDTADQDEVADELESFDENESLLAKLEPRYNEINTALDSVLWYTHPVDPTHDLFH